MIPRRFISALLIALTISGVFTFWLSRKVSRPSAPPAPKQQYVAAAASLEAGEVLHPENLKLIEWPVSAPLDGAFAKPEEVVGRSIMFPISAGEPITARQLAVAGSGSGLAVKIPDGMRAISMKSNEVVGVAGFLLPGTHVDVIMTYHPMNLQTNTVLQTSITTTILQDVQVLSAGQKIQPDPEGKASPVDVVTLLVTPQQAEKAVLASSLGSIHFVLRNGSDREQVKDGLMELSSLDQSSATAPRQSYRPAPRKNSGDVTRPASYQVETTLGTKASVETFK